MEYLNPNKESKGPEESKNSGSYEGKHNIVKSVFVDEDIAKREVHLIGAGGENLVFEVTNTYSSESGESTYTYVITIEYGAMIFDSMRDQEGINRARKEREKESFFRKKVNGSHILDLSNLQVAAHISAQQVLTLAQETKTSDLSSSFQGEIEKLERMIGIIQERHPGKSINGLISNLAISSFEKDLDISGVDRIRFSLQFLDKIQSAHDLDYRSKYHPKNLGWAPIGHYDLKPANVLYNKDNEVIIMDFTRSVNIGSKVDYNSIRQMGKLQPHIDMAPQSKVNADPIHDNIGVLLVVLAIRFGLQMNHQESFVQPHAHSLVFSRQLKDDEILFIDNIPGLKCSNDSEDIERVIIEPKFWLETIAHKLRETIRKNLPVSLGEISCQQKECPVSTPRYVNRNLSDLLKEEMTTKDRVNVTKHLLNKFIIRYNNEMVNCTLMPSHIELDAENNILTIGGQQYIPKKGHPPRYFDNLSLLYIVINTLFGRENCKGYSYLSTVSTATQKHLSIRINLNKEHSDLRFLTQLLDINGVSRTISNSRNVEVCELDIDLMKFLDPSFKLARELKTNLSRVYASFKNLTWSDSRLFTKTTEKHCSTDVRSVLH